MQIIKLSIEAETRLADTLSDYLIGILGAAVEFGVDENVPGTVIHGFLQMESCSTGQLEVLEKQVEDYAREMADIFQLPVPRVRCEIVPDQDWAKNWKEHFKAFEIIPDLVISPSWEPYSISGDERVIVMDPGMAFGTGHHATTRLCLRLLRLPVDQVRGCSVLDVGTGTGILGMAAVLFGAAHVLGIDNDRDAVTAAGENARRNKLQDRMSVSGTSLEFVADTYQLVVANIIHDVLIALADDLARVTAENGVLVLSGLIYGTQTQNIVSCFQKRRFRLVQEEREGEWGALKFIKTG